VRKRGVPEYTGRLQIVESRKNKDKVCVILSAENIKKRESEHGAQLLISG
jgi:hypothetical protein